MIKKPPKLSENPLLEILDKHRDKLADYLKYSTPIDNKGRYLHYHDFRYRVDMGINADLAWCLTKQARLRQIQEIGYRAPSFANNESNEWEFMLTPTIQKAMSQADRNGTTAALEWMTNNIGETEHLKYLLKDLIEDEAISSSQLEGASTTTIAAKTMLKKQRKPRTMDEKMILGNYKMMNKAWSSKNKPLSLDLILSIHEIGVEGIEDERYSPGQFRSTDDVTVVNYEGDTVHIPPTHEVLKQQLSMLCKWANKSHDDIETDKYIHPLIKAIVLHFAIGYFHPFNDGNGRVARALFYWFMFKSDYAAFRYIAISTPLKKAPRQYVNAYLFTETDEMDLTYFIDFQCKIALKSVDQLTKTYRKIQRDIEEFNTWLWSSGLIRCLNDKQKIIFQVAKTEESLTFTISDTASRLDCSYNAAAAALNGLVKLNIFQKQKNGREFVYSIRDKNKIIDSWDGC